MNAYGTPNVLTIIETAVPTPQPGEILLKVEAIGVNYSDVLRRKNTYFMPTPLPYILGAEAVGEIVGLGEGVPPVPFGIGSRVLAILPNGGGYSEYIAAQAQFCVPLPPNIDAATASAIFVQGSTAHLMVHQVAKDLQGKSVLIHAAAGGVGSLLVQLAKMAGAARIIATGSSDAKLNIARTLGADAAVNYAQKNWATKVIEANQGQKVDVIFEMVGGEIYLQSFECLAAGGTMIVYGAASGQKGVIHSEHFVDENQTVTGFNLAHYIQHKMGIWQESLGAMIGLLAEGKIRVHVGQTFALAEAAKAHEELESRNTTGKIVLKP